MTEEALFRVKVCDLCPNSSDLTRLLSEEAKRLKDEGTYIIVEESQKRCIGGCGYGSRVDVFSIDGRKKVRYAKDELTRGDHTIMYPIGDNPIDIIITSNLKEIKE